MRTHLQIIIKIILILLLSLQLQNQEKPMDLTIDFTQPDHLTLSDLQKLKFLHLITFELPFFDQLNKSFECLYDYVTYLNEKPLVQIYVKPKGESIKPKYQVVAVGGTFDHLHIGHQMLLIYSALSAQKKLIIGVTSDQMLHKKVNKQVMQSLLMRINQVRDFIKTFRPDLMLQIVKLDDPYGPTIQQQKVDAVIVSSQTYNGGLQINTHRVQKGWPECVIEICPIMAPISHLTSIQMIQNKISSTHIRSHILAKNGFTVERFVQYESQWEKMILQLLKIFNVNLDVNGNANTQKQQKFANNLIINKWWDLIIIGYSEYWRFYHTNHHIAKMFRDLDNVEEINQEYKKMNLVDQVALKIAIFFHDLVYRPDLATNEDVSALFAEKFINDLLGNKDLQTQEQTKKTLINKVSQAIICTKHHKASENSMIKKILCQLDMSVLDEHQLEKYKAYAFNIQHEYRPLHEDSYPVKRMEFLNKILKGKYHYQWRKGENLERNIKWEISHWTQIIEK